MQVCAHKCGGFIAYVLHFVSKLKSFVQTTKPQLNIFKGLFTTSWDCTKYYIESVSVTRTLH